MRKHRAPVGLMVELLAHAEDAPIAVTRPSFSWIVNGDLPGPAQTAYEIRVSSTIDGLDTPTSAGWCSGRVGSGQSIHVPYGGARLEPERHYHWSVRTWSDVEGEPSPWASAQQFRVGRQADSADREAVSAYPLQIVPVNVASTQSISPGRWFLDFGRQAFGWLEIEVDALIGGLAIMVRLGEASKGDAVDPNPPGSVRFAEVPLAVRAGRHRYRVEMPADARNTGPNAIKLPPELGVVLPFRYAEVEAGESGMTLCNAVQMRVQYPFDETAAHFSSSSSELDELWELCRYTMLATSFAGYYVDGDRERIPYEADAYINQLSHYAVDREFSLARRTHEYLLAHPTWPTEWKQHSILIAWADYEATGDVSSLRRNYRTLKNEKLLSSYSRADGLLATGHLKNVSPPRADVGDLVDWPPGERDEFDFRDVNTVVNAFHYRTLVLMEKIARAVCEYADAETFSAQAAAVFHSFNERLFDEKQGIYVDGEGSRHASQHANLFSLAFGLVPAERLSGIVYYVKHRGMACSVYPAQFLLEGLFKAREAEHAIGLMTRGGLRSWRNMLDHGATLTWEAWDQSLKPNQDWNHAWGAAPGNIIARYVLGVRPLEPGYGRVLIDPQLGGLNRAEGLVPTIRGSIHVRAWKDGDGQMRCEARAPANIILEYADTVVPALG